MRQHKGKSILAVGSNVPGARWYGLTTTVIQLPFRVRTSNGHQLQVPPYEELTAYEAEMNRQADHTLDVVEGWNEDDAVADRG